MIYIPAANLRRFWERDCTISRSSLKAQRGEPAQHTPTHVRSVNAVNLGLHW